MTVSVVLADDQAILRDGLRAIISGRPSFQVVGETAGGPDTVQVVESLQPEVLVLDLSMPDMHGREVIGPVNSTSPDTRIVVLSEHADQSYAKEALSRGANAYVVKSSGSAELMKAIDMALEGRTYVSASLPDYLAPAPDSSRQAAAADLSETLTPREREILRLVAMGVRSSHIAKRLKISRRTVDTYRANLKLKLRIGSQAELIRYAIQRGLV